MKKESLVRALRHSSTPWILAALVVGALIGWLLPSPISPSQYIGGVLFQSSTHYQYIDPLLACEVGAPELFTELKPLKQSLSNLIAADIQSGKATEVSVYFRSLRNAHWFSLNPNETYAPASLLKVFVMMAYYKESRDLQDPTLLQRHIVFEGSSNPNADDSPGAQIPHLVNGQSYTIEEVIKQMIVYSDNDALTTLTNNFDPQTTKSMSEIFSDLQIDSPLTDEKNYLMPVQQYAMIFRVLYGSTYLGRIQSEQALGLLAQAQYHDGIVAGVPANVAVAHKFGITTTPATDTVPGHPELHDCGIVYASQPYELCIMTQGSDFPTLQGVIQELSKTTYEEVAKLKIPK
jgi:hypothetical protein